MAGEPFPRNRSFRQVDVFGAQAFRGNPLAVVMDGTGLPTALMQQFTDWTNLSEATFLLPPTPDGERAGADYRVRIFCQGRELPFAGHPTLGTCHAWLESGGRPRGEMIVQECGAGLVRIRRVEGRLEFAAPPLVRSGPLPDAELEIIARGLGIERDRIVHHAWCDNGPHWRGVMLGSAAEVLALRPNRKALEGKDVGVVGRHGPDGPPGVALEVRAFFTGLDGVVEDPVTGSLNAAVAQWLTGAGLAPASYVARQGTCLGRDGRVSVAREGTDIWIGGECRTCIEGTVRL